MEYVRLKNSDLTVSRLCMGGCPLGEYGWGKVSENDLLNAVCAAVDSGVNIFDTADVYGLGKSEKNLGKALKGKRHNVVIATKFGVRIENGKTFYDNSPQWIREAVEKSLKRLGTDYIDIYQLHYRDGITPISVVVETLDELKSEGKIRYYGLSNIHQSDIEEIKPYVGSFVSFQDEYSLACRKNEEDIRSIADNLKLTPFTWGSLGQGILTGKYDEHTVFEKDDRRSRDVYVNFHGEKLKKNMNIVAALKEIAMTNSVPVSSAAIRFILDYIPDSVVLAGIKNIKQLKDNCKAFGWELDEEQLRALDLVSKRLSVKKDIQRKELGK